MLLHRFGMPILSTWCLSSLILFLCCYTLYLNFKDRGSDDEINASSASSENVVRLNKRVLVGIFCKAGDVERRSLVRSIMYDRYNTDAADVLFVIGQSYDVYDKIIVHNEAELYRDVFQLPVKENMDSGKTYAYYKTLIERQKSGEMRSYDYVMKADSDSFIRVDRLLDFLDGLPKGPSYIGAMNQAVMHNRVMYATGMGYLLSWDLVQKIATSEYAAQNIEGPEDVQTALWIAHFESQDYPVHYVNSRTRFRDRPGRTDYKEFTGPLHPDAIVVHFLKKTREYLRYARYYYADLLE